MNKAPPAPVKTAQAATELVASAPSADGVWRQLRLMPGVLADGTSIDGEVALVVEQELLEGLV